MYPYIEGLKVIGRISHPPTYLRVIQGVFVLYKNGVFGDHKKEAILRFYLHKKSL